MDLGLIGLRAVPIGATKGIGRAIALMLAHNPTGRIWMPQEMANATVLLASPAESFTAGTNLTVDGALTRGEQFSSAACSG